MHCGRRSRIRLSSSVHCYSLGRRQERIRMNFAKWRDVWKRFSGRGTYPHELFTRLAEALDSEIEWCNRRLLARIHRLTLGRLRREIAPVSTADFMRLLFSWQHAAPSSQLHGVPGALQIIEQLQGYEISAATWERDVLPRR